MTQNHFQRLLCIASLALTALLSACGGSSSTVDPLRPERVIAFGDGFNAVDAAGYGVNTVQAVVGTDLPDNTIAGRLAYNRYGITLTNVSGDGALAAAKKGFSYAQGSARIQDAATPSGDSLERQIANYLTNNKPGGKDLFIITAGGLDIYDAFTNKTALTAPVEAFVTAIKRLTDAGAKYILIVYPPNMARTPWAIRKVTTDRSAIQSLSYDTDTTCVSFSCRTTTALNQQYPATTLRQPILVVDLMGSSNLITGTLGSSTVKFKDVSTTTTGTGTQSNTYTHYGVTNPDLPACFSYVEPNPSTPLTLPPLTCSTDAATVNLAGGVNTGINGWNGNGWDHRTSVFADNFYFTPYANRLYADYIFSVTMYRAGWR